MSIGFLQDFSADYAEFNKFVLDLDRRLSAIINQAFDDCNSLSSMFKVNFKECRFYYPKFGTK